MRIQLFIICFLVASSSICSAQKVSSRKKKEVFIGIGSAAYRGDLDSGHRGSNLLFVAGIKLNTAKKLHGNLHLSIGATSGQELDYSFSGDVTATPNAFFKTTIIGLNYALAYNIIDKERVKLFLSQGIGFFRFETKDEFGNSLSDQVSTRALNEEYRNISIMLPSMIGAKYILNNGFGITLQSGFYNTMSDYLDNVSQWGNKSGNDNIFSLQLQVSIPVGF